MVNAKRQTSIFVECKHCGNKAPMNIITTYNLDTSPPIDENAYPDPDKEAVEKESYDYELLSCQICEKITLLETYNPPAAFDDYRTIKILYPQYNQVKNIDPEVPEAYKNEFIEAYKVAQISPKASAALSRRLLQKILRQELNIKQKDLAKEIDEFINTKDASPRLKNLIDVIRNIGNFAAHPNENKSTGEIVDVEAGEAEWLLEILEMLFDFVFIQPKREQEQIKKLNQKLKDFGKPPMK
jgi:hypothetical protein